MSDKIKKYRFLPWIIAVAVVIAVGILGSSSINWYILEPWAPASTLVAELSIEAFGAGTDYSTYIQNTAANWNFRLTALATIILSFVVGPSLWVYAEIKNQKSEITNVLKKGIAWYLGVILIISSLQVVPTAIVKGIVFQNTWDSAAESKNRDELRSDLMKLGYDVLEIYHLPNEFGGGAGTFQINRGNGDLSPLQVTDLESHSQLLHKYMLAPAESDSVIKIHGVSDYEGSDPDFENADGSKGKLQMDLEVKPPADFEFEEVNS